MDPRAESNHTKFSTSRCHSIQSDPIQSNPTELMFFCSFTFFFFLVSTVFPPMQAFVQWSAAADDGGGILTKYVVIASTAYADINVETITQVYPTTVEEEEEQVEEDGEEGLEASRGVLPTEATVTGLTNGLVYSFQVVATNAFGSSTLSLPSNKVCGGKKGRGCGMGHQGGMDCRHDVVVF